MGVKKRITVNDTDIQVRVHELGTGTIYEGPWGAILGRIDLASARTVHVSLLTDDPIADLERQLAEVRDKLVGAFLERDDLRRQLDRAAATMRNIHNQTGGIR